jgi:hypothetical protein
MGETNSPLVAHVGYDISILSTVEFKILVHFNLITVLLLRKKLSQMNEFERRRLYKLLYKIITLSFYISILSTVEFKILI